MTEKPGVDGAMINAFKMVAPGTDLREALQRIQVGRTGALIVVGDREEVLAVSNGGFMLDADFSAPRLAELSKMDGAVIISADLTTIRFANVHLVPDPSIPTRESGTRHRSAERVARQTGALVIAVSERLDRITLYKGARKHILEEPRIIVVKANQALQALEKYKTRLDQVSSTLSALELEDLVSLLDVVQLLQRSEMVQRIGREIDLYISELGIDGRLLDLQMDELMEGVPEQKESVIRDYMPRDLTVQKVQAALAALDEEELLQPVSIAQALGYPVAQFGLDKPLAPRGYRMIKRIPRLPNSVADNLVKKFKSLQNLMHASLPMLDEVDGVGPARAQAIHEGLHRISEALIIDRYM